MHLDRDSVRAWLLDTLARRGETPTALARQAGIAQSTLTRFLHDDDSTMLSLRTLAKIVHVAGTAPQGFTITAPEKQPGALPVPAITRPAGLAEDEATPLRTPEMLALPLRRAIAALTEDRNAADVWQLRTAALKFAGYLPGDLVVVDLNATPKAGDIVCAQVYQWAKGTAETIFRVYEPPYLVAASDDPALRRPLVVDNDRVVIKGVVTQLLC